MRERHGLAVGTANQAYRLYGVVRPALGRSGITMASLWEWHGYPRLERRVAKQVVRQHGWPEWGRYRSVRSTRSRGSPLGA